MSLFFILFELAFLIRVAPPSERVCFREALGCVASCSRLAGELPRERCLDECFQELGNCLD